MAVRTLPGWAQGLLAVVGISAAVELIVDEGQGDFGILPLGFLNPFDSASQSATIGGIAITGGWVAGGVQFYHLADGRKAVIRKNGTVKIWRPKRPIVLYSHGADDLQTFNKAARAIDRQASRLAKTMGKRGFQVRRKVNPKD